METEQIELEAETQLNLWLDEFLKPENLDKITLPNIPYSEPEISRELLRRKFIDGATLSWHDIH